MAAKHLRVLIVEDHADLRLVLGILVENLGHRVELAVDAGSALVRAREGKFDALLTDIGLPGRDGWALLRELGVRGLLPPRIISMSACHVLEARERSKEAGCHAHLVKPFGPEELEQALLCTHSVQ